MAIKHGCCFICSRCFESSIQGGRVLEHFDLRSPNFLAALDGPVIEIHGVQFDWNPNFRLIGTLTREPAEFTSMTIQCDVRRGEAAMTIRNFNAAIAVIDFGHCSARDGCAVAYLAQLPR
jgi:hypothetical protein